MEEGRESGGSLEEGRRLTSAADDDAGVGLGGDGLLIALLVVVRHTQRDRVAGAAGGALRGQRGARGMTVEMGEERTRGRMTGSGRTLASIGLHPQGAAATVAVATGQQHGVVEEATALRAAEFFLHSAINGRMKGVRGSADTPLMRCDNREESRTRVSAQEKEPRGAGSRRRRRPPPK